MISLKNSVETKYIKIEFNDDLTTYGLEEKPLGVRTIQFYGCALEDTLAVCGTHFTRVSTNINAYRHIGYVTNYQNSSTFNLIFRYDYNKKIFYFCDILPKTNDMQCYKYLADTKKV